ncbi:hypothetical protein HCG49_17055 [Arenibacter sp. 6A1]|uniref:hypothetical protein n=1 Tax=Arenibacter sp. 6A1 TaxID=2720391 RepID=UPI001444CBFA|nr:hypothetical protein [Arenibacter sp. 6A1]NKI28265.1 hypothetical protein [Arenibacter sp. 6A1]
MAYSDEIGLGTVPGDGKGAGLRTNLKKLIDNDNFLKDLAETIDQKVNDVDGKVDGAVSGFKGTLAIADTPTEDGYYSATESGTYANAGGLVVDLSEGATTIVKQGDNYSKVVVNSGFNTYKEEIAPRLLNEGKEFLNVDRPDLAKIYGQIISVDENLNILNDLSKEIIKGEEFDRPDIESVTVDKDGLALNFNIKSTVNNPENLFVKDSGEIDRPDLGFALVDLYRNIIYVQSKATPREEVPPKELKYVSEFYNPPVQEAFNVEVDPSWLIDYDLCIENWDSLVNDNPTNPEVQPYITKAEIGRSGAGDKPIYRYNFKPRKPLHRVLLMAGTHANEKMYIKHLFSVMKIITEDWTTSPVLEYFRRYVDFTVIPVRCPNSLSWSERPFGSRTSAETDPIPVSWIKNGSEVTIVLDELSFPSTYFNVNTYFTSSLGLEGKTTVGIMATSDTVGLPRNAYTIKEVVNGNTIIVDAPDDLGDESGTGELQVWVDANRNADYNWESFTPTLTSKQGDVFKYGVYDEKGTMPFSLPENRALKSITDVEYFDFIIDCHSPARDHYLSYPKVLETPRSLEFYDNIKEYASIFSLSDFEKLGPAWDVPPYPLNYYGDQGKLFYTLEWGSGLREATVKQSTDATRWLFLCISEALKLTNTSNNINN